MNNKGDNMKKNILLIIFGIMMFSVGVSAGVVLNANQVSYNNKTVEDALNDLYSKSNYGDATASDIKSGKTALVNGSIVTGTGDVFKYIGTMNFDNRGQDKTFNVPDYSNYPDLTSNDFVLIPKTYDTSVYAPSISGTCYQYNEPPYVTSYNSSTGVLTVNSGRIGFACSGSGGNYHYAKKIDIYIK